ncbi:hypothetical protein HHI36_021425 [Cryptolaemus montrouzieri]|uniref:Uncharacterized protein n=1 Tax=Cryptolaemus montrouzieri TaxID=559131 RepID=A0ABD2MWS6_9CUCU
MRHRITPKEYVKRNWLLVGIISCIFLAGLYPRLGSKEGPLHTEYSVKYGAVSLIFLISGLTLKTDSILHTFRQYKLHLFIQLFTFIFIPLVTQVFIKFLAIFGVNAWILRGQTCESTKQDTMPTTMEKLISRFTKKNISSF